MCVPAVESSCSGGVSRVVLLEGHEFIIREQVALGIFPVRAAMVELVEGQDKAAVVHPKKLRGGSVRRFEARGTGGCGCAFLVKQEKRSGMLDIRGQTCQSAGCVLEV